MSRRFWKLFAVCAAVSATPACVLLASARAQAPATPLQNADRLFAEKSYALAIPEYRRYLATNPAKSDTRTEAEYRLLVSLGETKQWDEAYAVSDAFLRDHADEPLALVRALKHRAGLLRELPTSVYTTGTRIYRSGERPEVATDEEAAKLTQISLAEVYRKDALQSLERAVSVAGALPQAERAQGMLLERDVLLDLLSAWERNSDLWGSGADWKQARQTSDWSVDANKPYNAQDVLPRRALYAIARLRVLAGGDADAALAAEMRFARVCEWYDQWRENGDGKPLSFAAQEPDAVRRDAARRFASAKDAPQTLYAVADTAERLREVVRLFPQSPEAKRARQSLYEQAKADAAFRKKWSDWKKAHIVRLEMEDATPDRPLNSLFLPGKPVPVRLLTKDVPRVRFTVYRMPVSAMTAPRQLNDPETTFTDFVANYGGLAEAIRRGTVARSWWHGDAPKITPPVVAVRNYRQKSSKQGVLVMVPVHRLEPIISTTNPIPNNETINVTLPGRGLFLIVAASPDGAQMGAVPVLVSDLTLVRKTDNGRDAVLAVDSVTGKPVAGVSLWAKDYEERDVKAKNGKIVTKQFSHLRTATTNAQGIGSLPALPNRTDLFARVGTDRIAFLAGSDYGYGENQHSYRTDRYDAPGHPEETATGDVRGVAFTDRPLYRPGHTVFYRAMLAKQGAGAAYSPLAGKTLTVTVENQAGETVATQKKTVGAFGTVNGSLTLGRGAPLGTYHVSYNTGEQTIADSSFRVEEYRKPEFVVSAVPEQSRVAPGTTATVRIAATRYDNTPVASAKVSPTLRCYWQVPVARWDYWQERFTLGVGNSDSTEVATGETVTDEHGAATLSFPANIPNDAPKSGALRLSYSTNISVRDAANRELGAGATVESVRAGLVVGIAPEEYAPVAGEKTLVRVQAFTATGEPATATGTITVRATNKRGEPFGKTLASVPVQTNVAGKATVAVPLPKRQGGYVLVFLATNSDKQTAKATESVYAYAPSGAQTVAVGTTVTPSLSVKANKKVYAPGDTARIVLRCTVPNATVLVSVQNDTQILRQEWVTLNGTTATFTVPVTRAYAPNLLVAAVGIWRGKLVASETELRVPPTWSAATITVTGDKATYKPGETGTFRIKATGRDGKPLGAEVSLGAVDASLYALASDDTPDLYDTFYNRLREMAVSVADGNNLIFPTLSMGNLETPDVIGYGRNGAVGMGGGAGAGMSVGRTITVRSDFRDTAAWFPAVVTDPTTGEATVSVTFPDSLTTWRATARGVSKTVAVGETVTEVVTRKNLTARLYTPRFAVDRDRFTVTALVRNDLKTAKQVRVRLESAGGIAPVADGFPAQTVTLAPGTETSVTWQVRANTPGTSTLRAYAETDEESDAVQAILPVLSYGVQKFAYESGHLDTGTGTASLQLDLPASHQTGSAALLVRVTPGIAGGVLDTLPYLADYPYGCAEQTMSRFLPSVIVARTLEKSGVSLEDLRKRATLLAERAATPTPFGQKKATDADTDQTGYTYPSGKPGTLHIAPLADELHRTERWKNPVFDEVTLRKMTDEGLARLMTMRKSDGGFGWWPDSPESDPYMTAYVAYGLVEAYWAGLPFEEKAVTGAAAYLLQHLQKKSPEPNDAAWELFAVSQCYAPDALPKAVPRILAALYEKRDALTPYGKALLALTLQRTGDHERAAVLCRNLRNVVVLDEKRGTASLTSDRSGYGWWHWYRNDIETTAWVLRAFLAVTPDDPAVPLLAEGLLQNRRGAVWGSTKETAMAVYALSEYMAHTGDAKPSGTITVSLAGKLSRTITVTPDTALFLDDTFLVPSELLTGGEQNITVSKTGTGTVRYGAALQYVSTDEALKGGGSGIAVVRRYFRGTGTARTALQEGDALKPGDRVSVELTVSAPNDYAYVLLEDFKPAGCEPTEARSGFAWGDGLWATCEKRDTKTAFFVERLPKGVHVLAYELRAETPGVFHALPVNAYAMYAPEVRATSSGAVMTLAP